MMKKGLCIAAIFMAMLVLIMAVPVSAVDVLTGVSVSGSTATPPVIVCKWEQDDTPIYLEDGDDNLIPGGQFNPPMLYDGTKTIQYYAVIYDPLGMDMDTVAADVYHPDSAITTNGGFDSFKYQVHLSEITDSVAAKEAAIAAYDAGLITLQDGYIWANNDADNSIMYLFGKGVLRVYTASEDIHYCQPAGDYKVDMRAKNTAGGESTILTNYFTYNNIPCAEFDFESVSYGNVAEKTNKWATGNVVFSIGDSYPTVRNIGNVPINVVLVRQDDMNFGKNSLGEWNVIYDIRMGDDGTVATYSPVEIDEVDQNVVLEDDLWMCHSEELDFSIHVLKGWSDLSYTGDMTLGYEESIQEDLQAP